MRSCKLSYEPCHVGPPKMDGSWWRLLTKCGPLEKGMANHFSILAEDEMVGWHHGLKGCEFVQTPRDSEGQGSLVCFSSWGCKVGHDLATEQQQVTFRAFYIYINVYSFYLMLSDHF